MLINKNDVASINAALIDLQKQIDALKKLIESLKK